MIKLKKFTFNAFQENTYLLWDDTLQCAIIDPGCSDVAERKEFADFIHEHQLTPTQLLYTHCHIDHILGHAWVCKEYGLSPKYHPEEEQVMEMGKITGDMYGVPLEEGPRAEVYLNHGDSVLIGETSFRCIHCPGHSPGSIVFYDGKDLAIAGDVLFRDSIGRTDLPGGNHEQLLSAIRRELYVLPDSVVIFPGHGPKTTIGYERVHNPFVRSSK